MTGIVVTSLKRLLINLKYATLGAIALFISACNSGPSLERLENSATILAFGDSLTYGKGTTNDTAYPAVLEALSGRTVINAGKSGETTAEGVKRLPGLLKKHDPELVILFEGGNDILQNLSKTATKQNLNTMISQSTEYGAQVVLVAVPEKSLFSSAAPWYGELAEEHALVLEDRIVGKLLKKPQMKSDSVHFNAEGYRAVAEAIYELMAENGAF